MIEIDKNWMAVDPHTDEVVAMGETKQEVEERLRDLLDLDPDNYDIVANPRNAGGVSI